MKSLLIVDDSIVFRSQIRAALDGVPGIRVAGTAAHGQAALEHLARESIDILILDLEMPVMNGLETLSEIKNRGLTCKVIVFSSTSRAGAEATLDALRGGAFDYATKPGAGPEESAVEPAQKVRDVLLPRLQPLLSVQQPTVLPERAVVLKSAAELGRLRPRALVIASSTGGPNALEALFTELKAQKCFEGPIPFPILLTQHMPPTFTEALAARLGAISGLKAAEGLHGEKVEPNRLYVAPGGFHMSLENRAGLEHIVLDRNAMRNSVRPAADFLFESAAALYGKDLVAVVLTGMGQDGKDGAAAVKRVKGNVLIQDRESCVVFGMPGAVCADGNYDFMASPQQLAQVMAPMFMDQTLARRSA